MSSKNETKDDTIDGGAAGADSPTHYWREHVRELDALDDDHPMHKLRAEDAANWQCCAVGSALQLWKHGDDAPIPEALALAAPELHMRGCDFSERVTGGHYAGAIETCDQIDTAIEFYGGVEKCKQSVSDAIPRVRINEAISEAQTSIDLLPWKPGGSLEDGTHYDPEMNPLQEHMQAQLDELREKRDAAVGDGPQAVRDVADELIRTAETLKAEAEDKQHPRPMLH